MSKHKKAGQRRKKYKNTGRRKTKLSGHSQPSFLSTHRKAIRALVVLAIVCAATAGVFLVRFLIRTDETLQETKQSPNQAEGQVLLPVSKPLRTEQEVIALKKEELELAEKLMKDFPGSDEPLVIMGNACYRHGNVIEALEFWNKALKINPKRSDIYRSMALLSMKKGTILRNDSPSKGHWLQVCLKGVKTNRDGIVARVKVVSGDLALIDEVHSGRGYQSHYGTRLHFGLGNRDKVDRIEVRWIKGGVDTIENVRADQLVTVTESSTRSPISTGAKER